MFRGIDVCLQGRGADDAGHLLLEDGALHDGKIALVTRKVAAAMAMGRPESNPHLWGGVLLCRAAAPSRDQPEQRADRRRGRGEQGIGFGFKK